MPEEGKPDSAPGTRKLDADQLRARVQKLRGGGMSLRAIAREADVLENDLSSFAHGSKWGPKRLERLALALDKLDKAAAPTEPPPAEEDTREAGDTIPAARPTEEQLEDPSHDADTIPDTLRPVVAVPGGQDA